MRVYHIYWRGILWNQTVFFIFTKEFLLYKIDFGGCLVNFIPRVFYRWNQKQIFFHEKLWNKNTIVFFVDILNVIPCWSEMAKMTTKTPNSNSLRRTIFQIRQQLIWSPTLFFSAVLKLYLKQNWRLVLSLTSTRIRNAERFNEWVRITLNYSTSYLLRWSGFQIDRKQIRNSNDENDYITEASSRQS